MAKIVAVSEGVTSNDIVQGSKPHGEIGLPSASQLLRSARLKQRIKEISAPSPNDRRLRPGQGRPGHDLRS
jgi:hypothetical protein